MIAAALVFGSAALIVFVAAMVMDHYEAVREWREWREEHPVEGGDDPWAP